MLRFDKGYLAVALWLLLLFTQGCFKGEPLNAECDIEEAYVEVSDVSAYFFNASDTHVHVASDNNKVIFDVRQSADLSQMSPHFVLTAGANITPANGSTHDFSNGPVQYTVTSEDGKWQRVYSVSFRRMVRTTSEEVTYDFENAFLDPTTSKYFCWTDYDAVGTQLNNWATANPAFMLARSSATADEYPTIPTDGVEGGRGVQLVTRSTGAFGVTVRRPLAAGNIFLGTFDISKALTETMKATRFGQHFAMKPIRLTGYYKYQPGAVYTDSQSKEVPGKSDCGTIHASMYRNHDSVGNAIVLYGDNVQSSDYIVAKLKIVIDHAVNEWQYFEVDFDYLGEIDAELLDNNGYSLSVVASSSVDGDLYSGAVGSTLSIDKFKIICEKIED